MTRDHLMGYTGAAQPDYRAPLDSYFEYIDRFPFGVPQRILDEHAKRVCTAQAERAALNRPPRVFATEVTASDTRALILRGLLPLAKGPAFPPCNAKTKPLHDALGALARHRDEDLIRAQAEDQHDLEGF